MCILRLVLTVSVLALSRAGLSQCEVSSGHPSGKSLTGDTAVLWGSALKS